MNKKTTSVALCAALVLGSASAFAQATTATTPAPAVTPTPEAAPTSSWVITPTFASQYMFRGVRLGGPSFEPSVEFDSGNLAVGVWANFPIKDKVVGQSDPEYDVYGSYTIALNEASSIVPGFTWYNYPRADKSTGFYKMTFEPSVAFNYTVSGFKITPKLYYDVILKGPTYELTGTFAVPLKDAGTELDFTATIGTYKWTDAVESATPSYKNWGNYWLVGVAAPFQLTKSSKLTLGVAYTKGSDNYFKQTGFPKSQNTGAVGRGVITVSYAVTF
ncbi:MAG: hypothetical protein JWM88_1847 [Verrucomicrobia bacterium]|nr:hypothetical protein [Verrucomicrobiota bacterium]